MAANSSPERPFIGKVEFDTQDPDLAEKIRTLEHRAKLFGSNVVQVAYRGMPVQVFVGTNHAYQYEVSALEQS